MKVRFALLAGLVVLPLAACADPQVTQQVDAQCLSAGYRAGTPEHAQCMDMMRQIPLTRRIN